MDWQWFIALWIPLLFLYQGYIYDVSANEKLCELNNGYSIVEMHVNESRGNETNQTFVPAELPIVGNLSSNQISLKLRRSLKGGYFFLRGKKIQLFQPLDRETLNVSYILFNVMCEITFNGDLRYINIILYVNDINDNAPVFSNTSYQEVSISEMTLIGTSVGTVNAVDKDDGMNAQIKYSVIPGNVPEEFQNGRVSDGVEHFNISAESNEIILKMDLDYEKVQKYFVTIQATDQAEDPADRLTSTTTFTVNVIDIDDQNPSFEYHGCQRTGQVRACLNPEYTTVIASGIKSGVLTLKPENIHAVDLDSFNSSVRYTFSNGTPAYYSDYFTINPEFGTVEQIKEVDISLTNKFVITVKAEEESPNRRSTTARLLVYVKYAICSSASDENIGYVAGNSPVGTNILDKRGQSIRLIVMEKNSDPNVSYTFEVLNNKFFTVDSDGYICVNEVISVKDPSNPQNYSIQIKAIKKNGNYFDSLPYQMTIYLKDVKNNSPQIATLSQIFIEAGCFSENFAKDQTTKWTTFQMETEDRLKDNIPETTTSSSVSFHSDKNDDYSTISDIIVPIALLGFLLVITVIVSIILSRLRCKACNETTDNVYQKPNYETVYTKPCDYEELVIYTDVNNDENGRLDYAGYTILENVDHSDNRHEHEYATLKTASVNRIGSKGTSTCDRSKVTMASKPVVYDYATIRENECEQSTTV